MSDKPTHSPDTYAMGYLLQAAPCVTPEGRPECGPAKRGTLRDLYQRGAVTVEQVGEHATRRDHAAHHDAARALAAREQCNGLLAWGASPAMVEASEAARRASDAASAHFLASLERAGVRINRKARPRKEGSAPRKASGPRYDAAHVERTLTESDDSAALAALVAKRAAQRSEARKARNGVSLSPDAIAALVASGAIRVK